MPHLLGSIRIQFTRHKTLAERAIAQLTDAELCAPGPGGGSSIAVICWHVSGNLRSRFTDFLTTDGEKPWRHRDEEFEARTVTRDELLQTWEQGWQVLLATLASLSDDDLGRTIAIRGEAMEVHDALHRALAHVSYHAGQIVYVAKAFRGASWTYLSIPPGGSDAYNRNPTLEPPAPTNVTELAGLTHMPYKPAGYTSVAPYLVVDGADATVAFLARVFDAVELRRFAGPDGRVMHAEVRIDDTVIMLADAVPDWPAVPAHVHVYVPDVHAVYERALGAGATSVQAPVKKDDDDTRGGVKDAGGTTWWIASLTA